MRIAVLGAAGYIGSTLVGHLLKRDHYVTALDNFSLSGTQSSLLGYCGNPRFAVLRGDVRDQRSVREAIREADVIVPLAGMVGAPACDADRWQAQQVNYGAIRQLVRLRSHDQRLVFPNSNSGYGKTPPGIEATEESPLNPLSHYARTKLQAEHAIMDAGNAVCLRLATVFGVSPRMRLDLLVNDFTYRAVTDGFVVIYEGHARRNYVSVRDVARAFTYAIEGNLRDDVYNVGQDAANLTKLQLAQTIREHVPSFNVVEAPVGLDVDQRDYVVSSAKIRAAGFTPLDLLDDGIRELLMAYQMLRRTQFTNIR